MKNLSFCRTVMALVPVVAAVLGFAPRCPVWADAMANPPAPVETPAPQDPRVPIPKTTVWKDGQTWQEVHESYVARAKKGGVKIVFLGDSITQWWPWQDFKARYAPLGAVNFGIGGDKVQNVLWRVQNGEMEGITPQLAVILIGTNNISSSFDLVPQATQKVIETIQQKSPTTKILLLGVFPRGWNKQELAFLRPKIAKVNEALSKLDNGKTVRYADVGQSLLEADGTLSREIANDGLHLTARGYRCWADAMQPHLQEMLGLPASAFSVGTIPDAVKPTGETPASPLP